jgi:hypothetical protein
MAEPTKAAAAKAAPPTDTATEVKPDDQAKAAEPAKTAPQDNATDTSGTEAPTDTGRGAGLHR